MSTAAPFKKPQTDMQKAASAAVGAGLAKFESALRSKIPGNRVKTRKFIRTYWTPGKRQGTCGVRFPANSRFDTEGTDTRKIVQGVWKSVERQIEADIVKALVRAVNRQQPAFRIVIEAK